MHGLVNLLNVTTVPRSIDYQVLNPMHRKSAPPKTQINLLTIISSHSYIVYDKKYVTKKNNRKSHNEYRLSITPFKSASSEHKSHHYKLI